MEKYAFYLVGAYGAFALALVVELVATRARLRRARARAAGESA
ncbi:MAG: heme exporter protein CcmD [Proteobacteria bacterium]|nr:heme exporter protein CcmD [Pseudomonadota bacterium]